MTRHKSPLEVYCVCNWLISVHLEIMTHLSICAIKKTEGTSFCKMNEHAPSKTFSSHEYKDISARDHTKRRLKALLEAGRSNIFNFSAQSTVAVILPSLYLHMLVPASQAHCAVLPNTCFCFTFELAVPEVIDLCPTRASGPAGKHSNFNICLFCWLLCESIWEISGSAGKLNIKIVLITLFMIWNVKGVARIDEPTENCHLRLQLHSVVGSLICLTNIYSFGYHSVSLAAAGSCFLKTHRTLSAQQQMAHRLRDWALLAHFYYYYSSLKSLSFSPHVKNTIGKLVTLHRNMGFLRRKKTN